MTLRRATRRYDQSAIHGACKGHYGAFDLGGMVHVHRIDLHPKRRRYRLDDGELRSFRIQTVSLKIAARITPGAIFFRTPAIFHSS